MQRMPAHAGLISFAAGASTLWELARFDPSIAMVHQSSIFLAHLASIEIDDAGVWTGVNVASLAIVHIIASLVYAGGALSHSLLFDGDLADGPGPTTQKFKLEWDNPE